MPAPRALGATSRHRQQRHLGRDVFEKRTQNAREPPLARETQNAAEDCSAFTLPLTKSFTRGTASGRQEPPEAVPRNPGSWRRPPNAESSPPCPLCPPWSNCCSVCATNPDFGAAKRCVTGPAARRRAQPPAASTRHQPAPPFPDRMPRRTACPLGWMTSPSSRDVVPAGPHARGEPLVRERFHTREQSRDRLQRRIAPRIDSQRPDHRCYSRARDLAKEQPNASRARRSTAPILTIRSFAARTFALRVARDRKARRFH